MIVIVRDTWRAVLVLVVGVLLMEAAECRRAMRSGGVVAATPPAPPVATATMQMPPPVVWAAPQQPAPPERPLRRVVSAFVELADSAIGVVR